jgi:hypothetical protein
MKAKIVLSLVLFLLVAGLVAEEAQVVRVTGHGKAKADMEPAQARQLAKRAAVLDGYRKLAAQAGFATISRENEKEYTEIKALLKGVTVTAERFPSDFEAEVDMEMPLEAFVNGVSDYKKFRFNRDLVRKLSERVQALSGQLEKIKLEMDLLQRQLAALEEKSQ